MESETTEVKQFIGIRAVCQLAGFSKATIHRMVKAGTFPAPVIRERIVVRWDRAECEQWRAAQFRKRAERLQQPEPVAA